MIKLRFELVLVLFFCNIILQNPLHAISTSYVLYVSIDEDHQPNHSKADQLNTQKEDILSFSELEEKKEREEEDDDDNEKKSNKPNCKNTNRLNYTSNKSNQNPNNCLSISLFILYQQLKLDC